MEENSDFSIQIFQKSEFFQRATFITFALARTHVSVDGRNGTAVVRFAQIRAGPRRSAQVRAGLFLTFFPFKNSTVRAGAYLA